MTAVDESAAMLAHVGRDAEAVEARLESLDLGRRFDVVVLASHLVNTADRAEREAFLTTVHRHLATDGEAFLQHHDPSDERYTVGTWTTNVTARTGDLALSTSVHERRGTWVRATTTMTLDGTSWAQHYDTELLDRRALADALGAVGLEVVTALTPTWTVARLAR